MGEEDADYAIKIMNMIKLYGKPIKVVKIMLIARIAQLSRNCQCSLLKKFDLNCVAVHDLKSSITET